jgi:hypothetical protein
MGGVLPVQGTGQEQCHMRGREGEKASEARYTREEWMCVAENSQKTFECKFATLLHRLLETGTLNRCLTVRFPLIFFDLA